MARERFEVSIVSQIPGTAEEVLSRAPIGAQKREAYTQRFEKLRDEVVKGRRGRDRQALLDWANESIPPRGKYKLDFSDMISAHDKARVFLPAIGGMISLMQEYMSGISQDGVALNQRFVIPTAEDLLDRICVVDADTLANATLQETDQEVYDDPIAGLGLPGGPSLVSYEHTIGADYLDGEGGENSLRHAGIHELWESLKYEERWSPRTDNLQLEDHPIEHSPQSERRIVKRKSTKSEDSDATKISTSHLIRREGLRSKSPGTSIAERGIGRIQEGFVDYLTRESRIRGGESITNINTIYKDELKIVDRLVGLLDRDPVVGVTILFQATFTKRGFRRFILSLNKVFGKNAYDRLGEALAEDYSDLTHDALLWQEGDKKKKTYPRTRWFLRSARENNEAAKAKEKRS